MPTIKNIGKQQRMVVDRFLLPGDARYISPKRVNGFQGDPDFEIVDESPAASGELLAFSEEPKVTLLKVQIVDDEPLQAKAEVVPAPVQLPKRKGASSTPVSIPAPLSTKKRKK